MITFLMIAVFAVLIFLCIPDFVQVTGQAVSESKRANRLSEKNLAR